MKDFTKITKALSDVSRVKMIKLLETSDLCVCEMQSAFNFTQPTISKHLKVLEDAGLIVSHKKGLWVHYSLNINHHSEYVTTLLSSLKGWFNDDPDLNTAKRNIKFTSDRGEKNNAR